MGRWEPAAGVKATQLWQDSAALSQAPPGSQHSPVAWAHWGSKISLISYSLAF